MRRYINRVIIFFMLICMATTLTGCWDYAEMTNLKYVAGMAIDKDKNTNEYILTLEILDAPVSGKSINSTIVQTKGKTIHRGLRDAIKKVGKMLQMSHAKVVIISKDIAIEGLIPVIDLINRDVEVRNDMYVMISEKDTAAEILNKDKKPEEILSFGLASAIASSSKTGEYINQEVFKLIKQISTKGMSATAPMVNIKKDGKETFIEIVGTAIFKKEKMIGKLNKTETMMLSILIENKIKFVMPIVLGEDKNISLELMKVKRKANTKVEGDEKAVELEITLQSALSEIAATGVNYIEKEKRELVKKEAEKYIETSCNKLIEKLQKEYGTDVLGIGYIFKKKEPREWEKVSDNWNKAFADTKIKVIPNIEIQYTGLNNKNIGEEEK